MVIIMKIMTRKLFKNWDVDSQKLTINITDNILTISVELKNENNNDVYNISKDINLSDYFQPYAVYPVFLSEDKSYISDLKRVRVSRNSNNLFKDVNYLGEHICTIYFNKYINELLIISNSFPCSDNAELYTDSRGMDVILKEYPDYLYEYNKRNKKKEILLSLDCNNSLSGLEPQVDYLTMILKDIIFDNEDIKNKLIKKYPNIENFFNVCGAENVLNIKPEEKLFEEIKAQKELIRQKQTEYYEVINEVLNG